MDLINTFPMFLTLTPFIFFVFVLGIAVIMSGSIVVEKPQEIIDITNESQNQREDNEEISTTNYWDDTILCSSILATHGITLTSPEVLPDNVCDDLKLAEASAISLVTTLKTLGSVVIITNAETGWVELSCRKFYPNLVQYLEDVRIISARSQYERMCPNPLDWKRNAFQIEVSRLAKMNHVHVLSLGDSNGERFATQQLNGNNIWKKTVKLIERPTVSQLQQESQYLTQNVNSLLDYQGDIDICLTA